MYNHIFVFALFFRFLSLLFGWMKGGGLILYAAVAFANQYGVCSFFKTDSNNKYIAGISNRFVVYKQCVLHLPAAWHAAKELRSADHSHLMVGQSSNNRIHTHVNKNYFAIDALSY